VSEVGKGFRNTLRALFTDRAAMSAVVLGAVLYSFFYPSAYHAEVANQLPAVIVDLDRSSMSRMLEREVLAVRSVRLSASVPSVHDAIAAVAADDAEGVLVIPSGFERDVLRGSQGKLALFGNGAFLGRGGTALTGLGDAVSAFGVQASASRARFVGVATRPPVQLVRRPLFNTREGYGGAVVPAVAILIVHQTLLLGIGLLIGTRNERRDRAALSFGELIGATAAFVAIGSASLFYYSGFVFWMQDYPRGGNLPGLLFVGVVFILAVVTFGLFVASHFRTRERALQMIALTSLPLFFLANISWPREATPRALTALARLLPTTSGLNALVKLSQMGARVSEVGVELAILLLLIAVYGSLAAWRLSETKTKV
jgi:ABC-2 type transport system permease protein